MYGNSNTEDKRLIDSLDSLLWVLKNPDKSDSSWRLRCLEKAQQDIFYAINGQMSKCNGKCHPTAMTYDSDCPIHGNK